MNPSLLYSFQISTLAGHPVTMIQQRLNFQLKTHTVSPTIVRILLGQLVLYPLWRKLKIGFSFPFLFLYSGFWRWKLLNQEEATWGCCACSQVHAFKKGWWFLHERATKRAEGFVKQMNYHFIRMEIFVKYRMWIALWLQFYFVQIRFWSPFYSYKQSTI